MLFVVGGGSMSMVCNFVFLVHRLFEIGIWNVVFNAFSVRMSMLWI